MLPVFFQHTEMTKPKFRRCWHCNKRITQGTPYQLLTTEFGVTVSVHTACAAVAREIVRRALSSASGV